MDSLSSTYPGGKRTRYHWIGDSLEQGETHYIWRGGKGKFEGLEDLK